MADAAPTLKQVTLELGGKSPIIVFDDAKLDNAVSGALLGNFYSAGEVCSNGTRVFVHRSLLKKFLSRLLPRVRRMRIGDPLDPATQVGALISEQHMHKVLGLHRAGPRRGRARAHRRPPCHRGRAGAGLVRGADGVRSLPGRDEHRARGDLRPGHDGARIRRRGGGGRRANATEFGLSAAVFTRDLARAHRVIAQLQAGTCWINHYNVTPIELPFGGVKPSGLGRENGRAAIEHYTQLKSVYVAMRDIDSPY